MGLGPIPAVKKVLEQAGMTIDDIDVLELNEAFAAQVVPCRDEWGIDPEKLNPNGGAIALGHPFGMTGARIMTTLLNNLDALDGTIGLETMCVAGGQGQAMIVERLTSKNVSEWPLCGIRPARPSCAPPPQSREATMSRTSRSRRSWSAICAGARSSSTARRQRLRSSHDSVDV